VKWKPRSRWLRQSPLFRQALDLLALVVAFLIYFHADVQLQIVCLPSLFP
jgi:hypothetical protein